MCKPSLSLANTGLIVPRTVVVKVRNNSHNKGLELAPKWSFEPKCKASIIFDKKGSKQQTQHTRAVLPGGILSALTDCKGEISGRPIMRCTLLFT